MLTPLRGDHFKLTPFHPGFYRSPGLSKSLLLLGWKVKRIYAYPLTGKYFQKKIFYLLAVESVLH